MLNYPYLAYLVRKVLQRRRTHDALRRLAVKSRILHPAETRVSKPAIFLSDHVDRIQAISSHCDPEQEKANIYGQPWLHRATVENIYRNVRLVDSHWYLQGLRADLRKGRPALLRRHHDFERLEHAALACSYSGNEYFGPFLREDLVLGLINEDSDRNIAIIKAKPYPHEAGYREALGCPAPRLVRNAEIGEFAVYEDVGQNGFKRRRYEALRARLRRAFTARAGSPGVFIRRPGDGARRQLANEADVEECFRRLGFAIVDPQRQSPAEIIALSLDAPIVAGVEGSHLAHGIYVIHEAGTFLVLQPPNRFSTAFKGYTDCMDMTFAFVVGTLTESGFTVDTGDIERVLERVERRR